MCFLLRVSCPGAAQSSGPYLYELHSGCQPPTTTWTRVNYNNVDVAFFIQLRCGESRESFKQRRITEAPRSLLCVSTDCAAERSCTQSGAPSPSQSASAHTLSSAKSKGSLRRQSKSVVWPCLFAVYIFCLCCTGVR